MKRLSDSLRALTLGVSLIGCQIDADAGGSSTGFDPLTWKPPAELEIPADSLGASIRRGLALINHTTDSLPESEIPADSLGASIRRGLALINHTTDSLPDYAPGAINCTNCHIGAGRNAESSPLTGAYVRYPKYLSRTGAVVGIADRVNYCFTRSLAGRKLPADSREMQDILAYLAWLSRGVPIGEGDRLPGAAGLPPMEQELRGDAASGARVYAANCVACHGQNGEGNLLMNPRVPAVWGPKSFSVGASMTRQSKAASFIWHNMPWQLGKTLTPQEAFDVAAYISSQPRPDSPGKENDWPLGGAPADVPYATKGKAAGQPSPPLLPRAHGSGAIVPPPPSVKTTSRANSQ